MKNIKMNTTTNNNVAMKLLQSVVVITCLGFSSFGFSQSRIDAPLGNIELRDTTVGDAIRILSEMSGVNIVATKDASEQKVTLFLQNTTVKKTLDSLSSITGLWYRYKPETGVHIVMTVAEYSRDVVVFRDEKMRIYTLKHHNVAGAADAIVALFGSRVQITAPSNTGTYRVDGGVGGVVGTLDIKRERSGRGGASFGAGSGATRRGVGGNDLPSVANLTPGQIAAIEAGKRGLEKINADKVGAFTQEKATIYVTFNVLQNLLFVRSSDEKALNTIAKMVKRIDKPASQVLLQMKIIQVKVDNTDKSIFDYAYAGGNKPNNPAIGAAGNILGGIGAPAVQAGLGNHAFEGGTFALQLLSKGLLARIQLLQRQGRTETLSSPMLLSSNNKAAELFIGEERILVTGAETNRKTVLNGGVESETVSHDVQTEKRKIGNRLRIWPRINADKTVTLDIDQEISTVLKGATLIPLGDRDFPIDSVTESTLKLTVIARHGQPVVVGGMINTNKDDRVEKVPFLGDIPGVGKLFRKTIAGDEKSELAMTITPYIMDSTNDIPKTRKLLAQNVIHQPFAQHHLTPEKIINDKTKVADLKGVDYNYTKMVKQAASRLHVAIRENKLENGPTWKPNRYLQVNPVASWFQNKKFVTAVRLRNLGGGGMKLSPGSMLKGWKTVAYEQEYLAAKGSTYGYVISDRSFADTIKGIRTR